MAAAASFTHVHNVAAAHGQPGWLAWADAVVLELMSIATGLEIRRRHRAGRGAGFVLWVLIGAVALSLSAQVVEAERSVVGWLAAALPAAGFLALVKIVLSRTDAAVPSRNPVPDQDSDPVPDRDGGPDNLPDGQDGTGTDQDDARRDIAPELLDQARTIATAHQAEHGRLITRDQLRAALSIGTTPASTLHRQIKEETTTTRSHTVPVPPDAFARTVTTTGGAR
jgi:hypothetical protein